MLAHRRVYEPYAHDRYVADIAVVSVTSYWESCCTQVAHSAVRNPAAGSQTSQL